MLQKRLIQTLGAMAGIGLLGMLLVYLACGKIEGQHVGFGSVFSRCRPAPADAAISPAARDALRNKILAGGCAGVLIGLGMPVWSLRRNI